MSARSTDRCIPWAALQMMCDPHLFLLSTSKMGMHWIKDKESKLTAKQLFNYKYQVLLHQYVPGFQLETPVKLNDAGQSYQLKFLTDCFFTEALIFPTPQSSYIVLEDTNINYVVQKTLQLTSLLPGKIVFSPVVFTEGQSFVILESDGE